MNRFIILLVLLFINSPLQVKAFETDFLVDEYLQEELEQPKTHLEYDYTSIKRVPVKLGVVSRISTKDKELYEGQIIDLVVKNNVFYRNKLLVKKDAKATARVETIVSSGMNGIPYYIYLANFSIPGLDSSKLLDNYHKAGANRTYIVLPLKWALTILPPTGSLTNFIMGGHAKIKEKDTITLFYYPEWK